MSAPPGAPADGARAEAARAGGLVSFVPSALAPPSRLARLRRFFRLPRKLKVTREGRYFIGITLGVGLAGINTGNNLLYLLLGMLLSLIIVSSVMSELSLRQLVVTRRLPPRAQVDRPHLVEIEVRNQKKRIPSYAIEVEDIRAGQPADKRCFFLKIGPDSAQIAAYRRTPARRGRDRHVAFRVATRFPFGLFEKSRELRSEGELIIYPAVDAVKLPPQRPGAKPSDHGALDRGCGDDILSVRPMRDGDDPRDIYWRKSTIADQYVMRERAKEALREVTLTIDSTHPGTEPHPLWLERFERRVRDVASRAMAHLKRGEAVTLQTTAGERVRTDLTVGADRLLRFLALLEPTEAPAKSLPAPPGGPGAASADAAAANATAPAGASARAAARRRAWGVGGRA